MAVITSHALNSLDGTHAGGITAILTRIGVDEKQLFLTQTDKGGRLSQSVNLGAAAPDAIYQLVFETGPYWENRLGSAAMGGITKQIVLRFQMSDPEGSYHMPVILSPNGYSTWMSGQPKGRT
jgi:5-hydroxyisourate hydrolase